MVHPVAAPFRRVQECAASPRVRRRRRGSTPPLSEAAVDLKGKRVVVTGADGFIGSHLTEALVAHGADVTAFCFYNSFNSLGWLDTIPAATFERLKIFTGDVRDPNGVRESLRG